MHTCAYAVYFYSIRYFRVNGANYAIKQAVPFLHEFLNNVVGNFVFPARLTPDELNVDRRHHSILSGPVCTYVNSMHEQVGNFRRLLRKQSHEILYHVHGYFIVTMRCSSSRGPLFAWWTPVVNKHVDGYCKLLAP